MLIVFKLLLRVGAKYGPTRFLTYVEAINGYRHLLSQKDIDKAASLCTSLRGHLKSRFIVLNDDRKPQPPPSKPGQSPESGSSSHRPSPRGSGLPGISKRGTRREREEDSSDVSTTPAKR